MKIKERIMLFQKAKKIPKKQFFEQAGMGLSNFSGKSLDSEIGSKAVFKILKTYPELSAEWLLRGEGEMLKKSEPEPPSFAVQEILTQIKSLNEKIDNMSEQIEYMKKTDVQSADDATCAVAG